MEVNGTAVRTTPLFVRREFGARMDEWLGSLSDRSRAIMGGKITTGVWYPLQEAFVEPTQKVCDLFFEGKTTGAWALGRFSADYALWGLYRLFVRIGSPEFLLNRAATVFSSYYRPSEMVAIENSPNRAVLHAILFPEPHELIDLRIGGWIERALEISGTLAARVHIGRSLARGDAVTEFVAEWR